jgi:hypothetical protein
MALTGRITGEPPLVTVALIANLARLAGAVAEQREASATLGGPASAT